MEIDGIDDGPADGRTETDGILEGRLETDGLVEGLAEGITDNDGAITVGMALTLGEAEGITLTDGAALGWTLALGILDGS